ncbi:MAG: DUF4259 domain-containing protein [Alphaproteobacteria bacterium]|nr:DUF4259 domain-containing protein [Alphaproteobacteria bacterium]
MGAWGGGGFENDTALDFTLAIDGLADIATPLGELPDDPMEEVDADPASRIIAAAECLAAMMGRPAPDLPDDLVLKLANLGAPPPELVEKYKDAVSRVLRLSELTELWAEADPAPFNLAITSLINRLNPDLPFNPPDNPDGPEVRQTCGFCNADIAADELYMIEVSHTTDIINSMHQGFWCHLRCLNASLHPSHIVQNWKFDPDQL